MNATGAGEMIVRFWGVRGSYPTPGGETVRYGGNTACVEIEANDSTIILDAGTGIVPLGKELVKRARRQGQRVSAVLLLSHLHHDHTQGFPFFTPAFIPGSRMAVYGPEFQGVTPLTTFDQIMTPPYFPVRLKELAGDLSFNVLREGSVLAVHPQNEAQLLPAGSSVEDTNAIRVRVLRSYAHPGGVLHYRIDWQGHSVVYATDTEGYVNGDRRLATFARGVDLLIHDAQYTDEHYLGLAPGLSVTQGFGHSTVSMACQVSQSADVKQLALFHHAPEYSDAQLDEIAKRAGDCFPNVVIASEGMEIRLGEMERRETASSVEVRDHALS